MVERTGGNADVDIALRGSGKEANLSGQIAVRDFTTTVDFTQVKIGKRLFNLLNW